MIRINKKLLSRDLYVACSGGVDSVAGLMFLASNHRVTLLHIDHGDAASKTELPFVQQLAMDYSIPIKVVTMDYDVPRGASNEAAWRDFRYSVFNSLEHPVVTCHHLEDCVETWVWSSMHGNPSTILWKSGNVIRPFLQSKKASLESFCNRKGFDWVHDVTNDDPTFCKRNYIRHIMMPHVIHLNPGINKVVSRILEASK